MNLILLIIGNILICLFVLSIAKDFLHPGFLFCVPWIIFPILLFFSGSDYDSSSFCYIYFLVGTIMFEMGCFFGHKKIKSKERLFSKKIPVYYVNYQAIKFLMLLEGIFIIFTLYTYFNFVRAHFNVNIFQSLHTDQFQMSHASLIIGYGRNLFSAFGICMMCGYSRIHPQEQEHYKKYITIQIFMCLFLALFGITRNQIIFVAIPIFMAFIVSTKHNNVQVFKKMIIAVVAFLILFGIITIMKYYAASSNKEYAGGILKHLLLYGTGGFVAFQQKFDTMNFLNYGGSNTFRFFLAVIDKVFNTNYAVPLVQEFSIIGLGQATNVYTFYHWYANDFGVFYALFIQFIIGILHGISYRKMSQMKLYGIYMYCILIHPLVMQIFQDQYFALTSTWIQFFIFGFVFLQTNILFSRTPRQSGIKIYLNE